ncbi:Uncharacterised protein [Vibrio cholerae]|nr:Uncharacterised protein [Vibrio cholerae]
MVQRCRWVQYHARLTAALFDELQSAVNVL